MTLTHCYVLCNGVLWVLPGLFQRLMRDNISCRNTALGMLAMIDLSNGNVWVGKIEHNGVHIDWTLLDIQLCCIKKFDKRTFTDISECLNQIMLLSVHTISHSLTVAYHNFEGAS